MSAPVLVVGFNRPSETTRVLSAVGTYSPAKVYLFCDGPRVGVPSDTIKVKRVRQVFKTASCGRQTFLKFQEQNLGVTDSMVAAIDWFFSQEESGIILEDDCVPHEDFFQLMERFLHQYSPEKRVWGASGFNPCPEQVSDAGSLLFIRSALVWGWCTWRDRWRHYDRDLVDFRHHYQGKQETLLDAYERHALLFNLRRLSNEARPHTWDTQLAWTVTRHDGLWGIPPVNLVSNIGVGPEATHTKRSAFSMPALAELTPTCIFPETPKRDIAFQRHIHKKVHRVLTPLALNSVRDIIRRLKNVLVRDKGRSSN